jgi:arsenical pump membrane protein
MAYSTLASLTTWSIVVASIAGVVIRPRNWPEAVWPVLGATLLVCLALVTPTEALAAVRNGTDVYLFLIGMMLISEVARREGLFDWLAARALDRARGSTSRLFVLVYAVGTLVTVFLSNDATAVVLTPAVYAVARQARVNALPYLFVCAFIANAASFVLPISNPANLVLYGARIPLLGPWLTQFSAAAVVAIAVTFLALRMMMRAHVGSVFVPPQEHAVLSLTGRIAAGTIVLTAAGFVLASARGWPLGMVSLALGCNVCLLVALLRREWPLPVLRQVAWSILALVAGLFVLVQAVEGTGALQPLVSMLGRALRQAPEVTAALAGITVGFASNVINNLPMGLLVASVARAAHAGSLFRAALLVGVDLGPNLSVTGSLATILWLIAIRREGQDVSFWRFLKVGAVVMPLSLLAALVTLLISAHLGLLLAHNLHR